MNKVTNIICSLLFIIIIACDNNNDDTEPYCLVTISTHTDTHYKGSRIPISVNTGEGASNSTIIRLLIDDQDFGNIQSAPNIFYWNTDLAKSGEHTIKAVFTTSDNLPISDVKTIEVIPLSISCPEEIDDIDGNTYPVVQIGNQCWMQENLKTTHYPDGEELLNGIDSLAGVLLNELPGWYFAYDKDSSLVNTYGYLYNWVTVMKGNRGADETTGFIQGICPDGWHVPDVHEWWSLIDYLGGDEIAADYLKSDDFKTSKTKDLIGFKALPGGCRVFDASYIELGANSYFWSATETIPNHAYHLMLDNNFSKTFILGHQDSKRFGYSVRCVKD